MIYFNKLTPYQSDILSNGKVIGVIERLGETTYLIEINYFAFTMPVEQRKLVKGVIERVYKRNLARESRERKPLREYKQFKIKE